MGGNKSNIVYLYYKKLFTIPYFFVCLSFQWHKFLLLPKVI